MNLLRHLGAPARLLVLALLSVGAPALAIETSTQRVAVVEAMRRSNDYYISTFAVGNAAWNRGTYHAGNFRAWEALGIQSYHDYSVTWATANSWLVGPEDIASNGHADSQACGQTYIDLYQLDPRPVRLASIKSELDALMANAASEDDWWWIDAFFMAAPSFARLGETESNPAYFVQLEKIYLHMKNTRGLFDPAHGLWYRDNAAKIRTGANTPEFWGRGNGWVIAACARVLEVLPAGDSRRPEFSSMLQTMAAALRPLQDADGFWRSNLEFPSHYRNPETSCTAFFTYAIAYGINQGLLDPALYTPVVMNAWNGIQTIALHPDGRLGYVQAIGAAPNGSDYNAQQDYGYGAFLLAGSEILQLLGGPPAVYTDAGIDQTLTDTNSDFVEPVTLDSIRSVTRSGSVTRYSWWLGSTYLGEGPQLMMDFPLGSHTVALHAEHSSGETFIDSKTITVNAPGIAVTAIGNETGNTPANTLDGSLGTRWSQLGTGQWIRYELPSATPLDHVDIAFYKGNERGTYFNLQLSPDGTNWTTVFSGQSSGTTLSLETYSFPRQSARFVRIVCNGTTIANYLWNSITEVSIPLTEPPADADANGIPDAWEIHHLGTSGQNPAADPNGDGVNLASDFILGSDPMAQNPNLLRIGRNGTNQTGVVLDARAAFGPGYNGKIRKFRLLTSTTLSDEDWQVVPGSESITGDNLPRSIVIPSDGERRFYKAASWLE